MTRRQPTLIIASALIGLLYSGESEAQPSPPKGQKCDSGWRLTLPPPDDILEKGRELLEAKPEVFRSLEKETFKHYDECDSARESFEKEHSTEVGWVCACQGLLSFDKDQEAVSGRVQNQRFPRIPKEDMDHLREFLADREEDSEPDKKQASTRLDAQEKPEPKLDYPEVTLCSTTGAAAWSWLFLLPWIRRRRERR